MLVIRGVDFRWFFSGTVILNNLIQFAENTNATVSIIGGQVQSTSAVVIANGTLWLRKLVFAGNATVNRGATFLADGVNFTRGKVEGAGSFVISSASYVVSQSTDTFVFASASFSNEGSLNVQSGTLSLEESSQINGQVNVNSAAFLQFAGNVVTSAQTHINGTVRVVRGSLSAAVGALIIYGNATVENAAQLASGKNCTNHLSHIFSCW